MYRMLICTGTRVSATMPCAFSRYVAAASVRWVAHALENLLVICVTMEAGKASSQVNIHDSTCIS